MSYGVVVGRGRRSLHRPYMMAPPLVWLQGGWLGDILVRHVVRRQRRMTGVAPDAGTYLRRDLADPGCLAHQRRIVARLIPIWFWRLSFFLIPYESRVNFMVLDLSGWCTVPL